MDTSGLEHKKGTDHAQAAPGGQPPVETIGSLMAERDELTQQLYDEMERLERFMLETGGSSDASNRIQAGIDSLEETLTETEGRLQALLDAQEQEAFAPEKKAVENPKGTRERTSVKQKLAEKKAEVEMKNPPEKKKERKSPGRGMEI